MIRKVTKYKIIGLYLKDYSRRLYLRELAYELRKPHQTIKPYVEELVKERILNKLIRKKITEYSLNTKSKIVYDYIVIAEKEKLIESLNEDILLKTLFEKLSPNFLSTTFLIFGSATISTQKASDIDLLVIGKRDISKTIKDFQEIYNKKIHKIQVTSLDKISLTLIKEIYKKHLILNNTDFVIRYFGDLYGQNKLV